MIHPYNEILLFNDKNKWIVDNTTTRINLKIIRLNGQKADKKSDSTYIEFYKLTNYSLESKSVVVCGHGGREGFQRGVEKTEGIAVVIFCC